MSFEGDNLTYPEAKERRWEKKVFLESWGSIGERLSEAVEVTPRGGLPQRDQDLEVGSIEEAVVHWEVRATEQEEFKIVRVNSNLQEPGFGVKRRSRKTLQVQEVSEEAVGGVISYRFWAGSWAVRDRQENGENFLDSYATKTWLRKTREWAIRTKKRIKNKASN